MHSSFLWPLKTATIGTHLVRPPGLDTLSDHLSQHDYSWSSGHLTFHPICMLFLSITFLHATSTANLSRSHAYVPCSFICSPGVLRQDGGRRMDEGRWHWSKPYTQLCTTTEAFGMSHSTPSISAGACSVGHAIQLSTLRMARSLVRFAAMLSDRGWGGTTFFVAGRLSEIIIKRTCSSRIWTRDACDSFPFIYKKDSTNSTPVMSLLFGWRRGSCHVRHFCHSPSKSLFIYCRTLLYAFHLSLS